MFLIVFKVSLVKLRFKNSLIIYLRIFIYVKIKGKEIVYSLSFLFINLC